MNVLVACETSGRVREAFRKNGHQVFSCDLLPADDGSPFHIQGDARDTLKANTWDLLIAHPPCTFNANSGVRWLYKQGTRERIEERWEAMARMAELFKTFLNADVPKIAIENPVIHKHAKTVIGCGQPSQTIQPWQFGHGETKATCLWLKGLPLLVPTNIVPGRHARVHRVAPSEDRWKLRSETYQGIADAMAEQWGNV